MDTCAKSWAASWNGHAAAHVLTVHSVAVTINCRLAVNEELRAPGIKAGIEWVFASVLTRYPYMLHVGQEMPTFAHAAERG